MFYAIKSLPVSFRKRPRGLPRPESERLYPVQVHTQDTAFMLLVCCGLCASAVHGIAFPQSAHGLIIVHP